MTEIKFLDLTADNAFDFCAILGSIGIENMTTAISRDDITALQKAGQNTKAIGLAIAMKVAGVFIKHISNAREPIYRFFAGCCEWENGMSVTLDELRKMKLSTFLKLITNFFKNEDLVEVFTEVAGLFETEANSEAPAESPASA